MKTYLKNVNSEMGQYENEILKNRNLDMMILARKNENGQVWTGQKTETWQFRKGHIWKRTILERENMKKDSCKQEQTEKDSYEKENLKMDNSGK